MAGDYIPMKARRKDTVKLGEPIQYGEDTSLIEMPISWTSMITRISSICARRAF